MIDRIALVAVAWGIGLLFANPWLGNKRLTIASVVAFAIASAAIVAGAA